MSELDRLRYAWLDSPGADLAATTYIGALQDRIAALEAENERLKVCGNCKHAILGAKSCTEESSVYAIAYDPCHFTPSRWTERGTP